MSILGFFFLVIFILLFFGMSIINGILRFLFGGGRKQNSSRTYSTGGTATGEQESPRTKSNTQYSKKKKIFSKDEGEYVDFEEIKEE